jgi:hypothetical protein
MFLRNEYLLEEGLFRAISHLVGRRLSMSALLNFFSNRDRMVVTKYFGCGEWGDVCTWVQNFGLICIKISSYNGQCGNYC